MAVHQLHLRAQGVVAFEQTGQEGGAHRIRQRDAQTAADLPGGLQGSLRLLGRGQQGACIAQKGLARIGEPHGLAHAVEQRCAQLCFQLCDLGGHRRLGIAKLPRSAGKAVQLGDVQKGIDVPQFHKRFLSAAGDAGHGEHLAIHGKMHLYRAELHAVHPLRVVLVGGARVTCQYAGQGGAVGLRHLCQQFGRELYLQLSLIHI